MAYKVYETAQGSFCIDWATCVSIIKSYQRAVFQTACSHLRRESQISFNPLSWGLPDLTFLEVDWAKVSGEAAGQSLLTAYRLAAIALFQKDGVDVMVRELRDMQHETRRLNGRFKERMQSATRESMGAMEQSIAAYQSGVVGIDNLRILRDLSGSVLIGATTVMSAGTAGIVLAGGGGTILKTVGKYQDTGNAGVAAIEATQSIVCTVIPALRAAPMGTAVKVIVTTSGDTGKALMEGRPGLVAVAVGAVGGVAAAGGDYLKKGLEYVLPKTAVPIVAQVIKDVSKKKAQQAVVNGMRSSTPHDDARIVRHSGLADSLSFADELLLKLAVVDMAKGIGHSWW